MLSDIEILERLVEENPLQRIVITPMIAAEEQVGPSSVDVHLGTEFVTVESSKRNLFDPLMSRGEYQEWLKHVRLTNRYSVLDPFILHPWEFALASTLEFISLPTDIVGHIDGRSSWARQGLRVHSTAGNIHPGSRGFIIFELENVGPVPIVLYPGIAIAQLTFELLGRPAMMSYSDRPSSKYFGFRQTLWSGYPDDSILRAMRAARARNRLLPPQDRFDDCMPEGRGEHRFMARQSAYPDDGVPFAQDFEYFTHNLASFIRDYAGKYVAIVDRAVVDADDDFTALSRRTYERYGSSDVYMPYVDAVATRPRNLGGPRRPAAK